ncbi:MAG: tRNA uridine-5-carboxymethylaminomethyl(34) synthesis GTPase MnmE [Pyrinomonadaceae bacterium]
MDTIVALGTPNGRSAIGVIRLTGPQSLEITRHLVRDHLFSPSPAQVVLKNIKSGEFTLDQALLTFFQAPNSFTGEDVVEISCHGSPVILRQVIDVMLSLGARLAGPGEFTLRAMRNGKLNLTQAEAIRDLINAQTAAAAQQALRQLDGELSFRLNAVEEKLIEVIVQLESAIEFVEDDLPNLQRGKLQAKLENIAAGILAIAQTFEAGHLLRDGLKVTLVGRPNVGKSSLFNKLLASERAIVTEIPGTTRDTLTEQTSMGGIPVLLTDTAGLRESSDRLEALGVDRTQRALADADLAIVVIDGSEDLSQEDLNVLSQAKRNRHVVAMNKSDLDSFQSRAGSRPTFTAKEAVNVSAISGAGLSELRTAILSQFGSPELENGLLITNARHYDLLCRAFEQIQSSEALLRDGVSEEIVVSGLHNALRFLGEITGETTVEEILSEIFATFCIGK